MAKIAKIIPAPTNITESALYEYINGIIDSKETYKEFIIKSGYNNFEVGLIFENTESDFIGFRWASEFWP